MTHNDDLAQEPFPFMPERRLGRVSRIMYGIRLTAARHLLPACLEIVAVDTVSQPDSDIDLGNFRIQQAAYGTNFCVTKVPFERQTELLEQITAATSSLEKMELLLRYPEELQSLNLALIDISDGSLEQLSEEDAQLRAYVGKTYPDIPVKRVWRGDDRKRNVIVTKHPGDNVVSAVRNRILTTIGDRDRPISKKPNEWTQLIIAKREYLQLPNGTIFVDGAQDSESMRFIESAMKLGHEGVVRPRAGVLYAYIERHRISTYSQKKV